MKRKIKLIELKNNHSIAVKEKRNCMRNCGRPHKSFFDVDWREYVYIERTRPLKADNMT